MKRATALFSGSNESERTEAAGVVLGTSGDDVLSFTGDLAAYNAAIVTNAGASTNTYTGRLVAELGSLTLNTSAGNDTVEFGDGGLSMSPGRHVHFYGDSGGTQRFDVKGGVFYNPPSTDVGGTAPHLTVNVHNGATAIFNTTQKIDALEIDGGGLVLMTRGMNKTLATTNLVISPTGRLDISNNYLIVNYSGSTPVDTIRGYLSSGAREQRIMVARKHRNHFNLR